MDEMQPLDVEPDVQVDEPIEPPAPAEPVKIEWAERNGLTLSRAHRTIKMFAPYCSDCVRLRGRWWETCPHDPYFSEIEREVRKPILKQTNDGRTVIDRYEVEIEYVRSPNLRQVHAYRGISAGMGVEKAINNKGYKHLHEMNFAPVCEYLNCWSTEPLHSTQYGKFCSLDQAKAVALRVEGIPVEVTHAKKIRRQLNQVVV